MKKLRFNLLCVAVSAFALLGGLASSMVHAGALLDYQENKVLDWMIRGQSYTPPAANFLALGTNTCSDSGTPTEPSGAGYSRISYTSSLANWSGTQSAASTVASSGTGGTTSNNAVISYSVSTGAWASGSALQSVWFMDASTAGNALICINLTSSLSVTGAGFTLSFPAAALSFQIDN